MNNPAYMANQNIIIFLLISSSLNFLEATKLPVDLRFYDKTYTANFVILNPAINFCENAVFVSGANPCMFFFIKLFALALAIP